MNVTPEDREYKIQLDMEVILSEEDKSVYVKFKGFDTLEEADVYADYLQENLPFLLYQSSQRH